MRGTRIFVARHGGGQLFQPPAACARAKDVRAGARMGSAPWRLGGARTFPHANTPPSPTAQARVRGERAGRSGSAGPKARARGQAMSDQAAMLSRTTNAEPHHGARGGGARSWPPTARRAIPHSAHARGPRSLVNVLPDQHPPRRARPRSRPHTTRRALRPQAREGGRGAIRKLRSLWGFSKARGGRIRQPWFLSTFVPIGHQPGAEAGRQCPSRPAAPRRAEGEHKKHSMPDAAGRRPGSGRMPGGPSCDGHAAPGLSGALPKGGALLAERATDRPAL